MKSRLHAVVVLAVLLAAANAFASVTVTPASGGTSISADTAGSTYTTLGNIVITEGATADFTRPQTGVTLILSAPAGWSFNAGTGSTSAQPGRDVSINSTTVTASTITVNMDVSSSGPAKTDILTISGIQVRPNNGSQAITANGNITASASSTVSVSGITAGVTNFGSLAMVAGNAHHLSISTQPSAAATAGSAFATQPVIRIEDQFNNLRSGDNATVVTAARSAGSGTLQGTLTATASSGVATFTNLSHNVATTITIAFSAPSLTGATSNNIVVSAAAASALVFSTSPGASTAGSLLSPQPVVRTVDAYGNNSTSGLSNSVPITISIASGTGTLLGTTVNDIGTDWGNGQLFYTDLKINQAGTFTLGVSGFASGATSSSFVVSPAAADHLVMLTQPPASAQAGIAFSPNPQVRIVDAYGNTRTSDTTLILAQRNSGSGTDAMQGTTSVNAVAGIATFTNLKYNVPGETIAVDFSASGLTGVTSSSVSVSAGPAATFLVSTAASTNAGDAISVTVIARDSVGNTATGYTGTVHFTSNDGQAVLPGDYTFTGGDAGVHLVSVTLKTAGSRTVVATDTVTSSITGTANVTVNAAAAASLSISAPGSATAGTPFSVTVTAKDAYNNTATGYTGTVSFSTTDANSPVLPSSYAFTGGDAGTRTFTNGVTLKTAGTQTVSVSDGTFNASSGNISVGAATVNSLTISAPGSATAGTPFSVTVTAKDAFNNTATGYTGTVSFSTTDANSPVLPSNYTFTGGDAGTHTFTNGVTLKTAGNQTVSISDGTRNATSGTIVVGAGTVNSLTISAPGSATAGTPFSVTVTAKDAFNNTATGYTGTVSFSSTDPNAPVLPSNYTFTGGDAGTHTFTNGVTLKTAGARTVSVSDGTRNATSGNISVSAGAAAAFTVTIPASATAGVAFSGTITAKDAYNNTATTYTGTVHFTTSDANAPVLPSNYTFTGGDAGVRTFTNGFTLKTAGSRSVTATDTVTSSITGTASTTVSANNAAQLGFYVQPAGAQAGSVFSTQPVIKTLDAYGNVTTQNIGNSKTVTITLQSGTGTLQGSTSINIGDNGPTPGTATFTNLRIDTVGAKTLRASNNTYGTVDSSSFTVTAGTATQLYFSTQPGGSTAGAAFTQQPVVKSRDSFGNDSNVGLGASKSVTMALLSGTGSLLGTTSADIGTGAGNGTAAFTNLQINSAGSKTLRASASGLTNADSNAFTVSAGAPAAMTKIAGDGQTAAAGATLPTAPSVRVDDAYGNNVSGVSVTFAVATGGGSASGTSQSTNASGVATVGSWSLGPVAGANTLTATAGALSQTFTATGICTYTSKASGNWNAPSTWVGECVPGNGDDVTIASGHTVTVTANAQAASLTFATATANSNVVINSGVTLVVEGAVTINAPSQTNVAATMNVGDGTLDAGSLDLNGAGNRKAILTIHNGTAMFAGDATFGGNPPTQIIETTGSGTFEIKGNFATGGSLDTDATSTFLFDGSSPQTIGTYNPNNFFPNVIIDNDVSMLGNMPVRSTLTINSGKTFDAGSGTLHLRGNFVDNGTFTSSGTTNVSGSAAQTFSGTQDPIPFAKLTMNNAAGLTLNQNVTVSGVLTLTLGNLSTGSTTFELLGSGSVSRTSGHVIGNYAKVFNAAASKTFETGTANGYSPVTINATAGSFPGTFTVKTTQAQHPNSPTANALQRYWTLTNGSITQADLSFTYLATDVIGNELAYRVANYNSGWLYPAASVDTINHVGSTLGATSFADYTLHAQAVGLKITSVNGGTNPNADNAFSVDVEAIDAVGDPAGVPVNTNLALTLTTGTGTLGGTLTGTITAGNSSTTISGVTYRKAESGVVINAAVTSGAALAADDSDPFTVDPGATTHFDVSAPASATAGTAFTATVTALDAWDNVTPAFGGTVHFTSTDSQAVLPADGTLSSGIGTYTNGVTLKTAGSQTITATSSAISGSANVTVNPAAPDHLTITAPASTTAGNSFSAGVTAYDAYGNITPSYAGTVALTSSDANATLPAASTLTSGSKTFTGVILTTAGARTITANDGQFSDVANITVNPGALDHFLVDAAGGGSIAAQTAGAAFDIEAIARDAYDNTVTSFNSTVQITSNATLTGAPLTSASFVNGVLASQPVTITSAQTGTTISATDTISGRNGTSNGFTVDAGALDHFRVETAGGGVIADQGVGIPFAIQITAADAYDNTVLSFNGAGNTADITSTLSLASGSGTTATFVDGVLASHSVSYAGAGTNVTITATRTSGSETGTSNAFDVGGLPDLEVTFTGPASIDAGDGENFTFNVTNHGVAAAHNVILSLTLPAGWSSHPFAPCAAVPCNLGTLAPSASLSVTIRINAPAAASGKYTILADVTADESDNYGLDNSTSRKVSIGHCPSVGNLAPSGHGELAGELTWDGSNATSYDVYFGLEGSGCSTFVGSTTQHSFPYSGLALGQTYEFRIVANKAGCLSAQSSCVKFTTTCVTPRLSAVAETVTDATYHVHWTDTGAARYYLEESNNSDFAPATGQFVEGTSAAFQHDVTEATPFYYRVRGEGGCSTTYSDLIMVAVQPHASADDDEFDLVVEQGADDDLVQQIHAGAPQGVNALSAGFTATSSAPWATVSPSAGTIPPGGITLDVTANAAELPVGTSNATINVRSTDGALIAAFPLSIHAMVPVDHGGKSASASDSAIIPAAGHAIGIGSRWRSDVRIFNPSAADAAYDLYFTPSRIDGTTDGRHSRLTIGAGATTALGDVVRHLFGYGTLGNDSATGALEIRPVDDAPMPVITSRTYNATSNGTYGQYIGAVLASNFARLGTTLSLPQVAQSSKYRTNLGLVEGSGQAASVIIRVFDASNTRLLELPVDLAAFEQRQLDSVMAQNSVSAGDARIEVEVTSQQGSVAAYASVVDMGTNDPLLVPGVDASAISATRYVIPGVADLTTPTNRWRSDVRVYNAGNASVTATAIFYATGSATPIARPITIAPHAMRSFDGVVQSLFAVTNRGGAMHITTPNATSLVVTARTYDSQPDGTYGQFIPAMTANDAATLGGRTLELLHVDQSVQFRSNIGLAEIAGRNATVEITAYVADGRTATRTVTLNAYEFVQYNALLTSLGLTDALNARLSIRVIGGQGAVLAYASNIDNRTQDPTYIPAQ